MIETRKTPRPTVIKRDENIARVANQAAENLLAHAAHLNRYDLSDAQFDAFQAELANVIGQTLQMVDVRTLAAELDSIELDDPAGVSDAEALEIQTIRNDELEYTRRPRTADGGYAGFQADPPRQPRILPAVITKG